MTGQTILVADPDAGTVALVRHIVEPQGMKAEAATDGLEALAFSLEAAPALVLADLGMPRMGGLELLRAPLAGEHLPQPGASDRARVPVGAVVADPAVAPACYGRAPGARCFVMTTVLPFSTS